MSTTTTGPSRDLTREIEVETLRQKRRAMLKRWVGNLLTVVLYLMIAFVFVAPMFWVLGNSFRSSQSIWANVYPVSWRTFIPYDEFSLNNYAQALGIGGVAQGLGF